MLYNHLRETVWSYTKGPSACPECGAELTPRKGEIVVWHWAHKPKRGNLERCAWEESSWHLRWKHACMRYGGYTVEHPLMVGEKKFVIDAYHVEKRHVIEFVHSLSPSYVEKHRLLRSMFSGRKLTWIFDGSEFGSARAKYVRGGGIKRLLKPRAKVMHDEIGGVVHIPSGKDAGMWKHWKHDVWYKSEHSASWTEVFNKAYEERPE